MAFSRNSFFQDGNRKDEEEKREQNAKLIIDAAAASELDSLRVSQMQKSDQFLYKFYQKEEDKSNRI